MSYSRSTLSLATVVIIFLAIGAGVAYRMLEIGASEEAADDPAEAGEVGEGPAQFSAVAAQAVSGASATRDTLWIRVRAAGQAAANSRTTVTAQVAGNVQSVPVRENSRVSAGALLLQIDTVERALDLLQARSSLLSAETDYRQRILFDDEIEDEAVRAERERIARSTSGLEQATVDLQRAELEFERTRVRAPFGGRVADLLVDVGHYVGAGTELMTIIDLDPIKVEVQVLEAELGSLSAGRRAEVTFAAFPGETFVGRVETINPLVDPQTRTGRVTVELANPEGRIKPGMYAVVALDAEALPDRLIIPREALLQRDRRDMLFVMEDGPLGPVAKWRYVNPGRANDTHVELMVEGPEEYFVEPGEVVLTDGHHYLAHDTPVRLVDNVAAEGGRPGR